MVSQKCCKPWAVAYFAFITKNNYSENSDVYGKIKSFWNFENISGQRKLFSARAWKLTWKYTPCLAVSAFEMQSSVRWQEVLGAALVRKEARSWGWQWCRQKHCLANEVSAGKFSKSGWGAGLEAVIRASIRQVWGQARQPSQTREPRCRSEREGSRGSADTAAAQLWGSASSTRQRSINWKATPRGRRSGPLYSFLSQQLVPLKRLGLTQPAKLLGAGGGIKGSYHGVLG